MHVLRRRNSAIRKEERSACGNTLDRSMHRLDGRRTGIPADNCRQSRTHRSGQSGLAPTENRHERNGEGGRKVQQSGVNTDDE